MEIPSLHDTGCLVYILWTHAPVSRRGFSHGHCNAHSDGTGENLEPFFLSCSASILHCSHAGNGQWLAMTFVTYSTINFVCGLVACTAPEHNMTTYSHKNVTSWISSCARLSHSRYTPCSVSTGLAMYQPPSHGQSSGLRPPLANDSQLGRARTEGGIRPPRVDDGARSRSEGEKTKTRIHPSSPNSKNRAVPHSPCSRAWQVAALCATLALVAVLYAATHLHSDCRVASRQARSEHTEVVGLVPVQQWANKQPGGRRYFAAESEAASKADLSPRVVAIPTMPVGEPKNQVRRFPQLSSASAQGTACAQIGQH